MTLHLFKKLALAEGISFLLLLFVAMPLKYWLGMPILVKLIGPVHGFLFIFYIIAALVLAWQLQWNFRKTIIICFASVVPLGTFFVNKKIVEHNV